MRRREFIAGLGGAAAWPFAARAQQADRFPLVAVMTGYGSDVEIRANIAAFMEALARLGWTDGRNVRIEIERYGPGDASRIRATAAELAGKAPNVILTVGTESTEILKQRTSIIPIVFVNVADPVAGGLVASFAHPAGNITGFTSMEFSFAGKWLSILRDLAPSIASVMVLYFPENPNWAGYLRTIEAAAKSLQVSIRATPVTVAAEIAPHIEAFAREPAGGMIVVPSGPTIANREIIAALAARYRLPSIYPYKSFANSGGLASYGSDTIDVYRRAAEYVDRILRGAKPGDLPVQAPTKFEFVINLKAAKAIGIAVPDPVLLLADEVIE
jgi:putative tryptophan/tyrosine transport system substrate-binding protein